MQARELRMARVPAWFPAWRERIQRVCGGVLGLFAKAPMHNASTATIEGVHRGRHRPYAEAIRLNLIDPHIATLVEAMNIPGVMRTIACCEGHVGLGRYSSPYVAFEASIDRAARWSDAVQGDALQASPRLRYHWEIVGKVSQEGGLVFVLSIPAIDRCRWVSRRRLNADIAVLEHLAQEVLGNLGRDDAATSRRSNAGA